MRLLFLGTGASEGYPSFFCACANCREARALGGRSHRLRSALLINDDLLVDLGPDLMASAQRHGVSLSQVETVLVTHRHEDHLDVANLKMRKPEQMAVRPPRLMVFGPRDVVQTVRDAVEDLEAILVDLQEIEPGQSWSRCGYHFRAYLANHGGGRLQCQFYSIDDGRHRVLYALDTGPLPEAAWQALVGQSFDCIVLEETLGHGDRYGHMNLALFLDHCRRFQKEGMVRQGGRIFAQHISHMWNPVHDRLAGILEPVGVLVPYDGLIVEL